MYMLNRKRLRRLVCLFVRAKLLLPIGSEIGTKKEAQEHSMKGAHENNVFTEAGKYSTKDVNLPPMNVSVLSKGFVEEGSDKRSHSETSVLHSSDPGHVRGSTAFGRHISNKGPSNSKGTRSNTKQSLCHNQKLRFSDVQHLCIAKGSK